MTMYGFNIKINKPNYVIISRELFNKHQPPTVSNTEVDSVAKYQYMGTTLNLELDHTREFNKRIEMARMAFTKAESIMNWITNVANNRKI